LGCGVVTVTAGKVTVVDELEPPELPKEASANPNSASRMSRSAMP
jgi:hypothetical protein